MAEATARQRTIALALNATILMAVHYFVVHPGFLPSEKGLWFYNGIASLFFGRHLLNRHFIPPADAATNGFLVTVTMLAATVVTTPTANDLLLAAIVGSFGVLVLLVSIFVLIVRVPGGVESRAWMIGLDQTVRRVGSPTIIYTAAIIAVVWLFHREQPTEILAILATWFVIVALSPVEKSLRLFEYLRGLATERWPGRIVGVIVAYHSPGILLIRQSNDRIVERGTPLLVSDDRAPRTLAVALNYVGHNEDNLLRCLTIPVPANLEPRIDEASIRVGVGVVYEFELSESEREDIPDSHPASILKRVGDFCGVVDEGTTLNILQFEVLEDCDLTEGKLVTTVIGGEPALFQVIEAHTRVENDQWTNKHGYARAKARKIGHWNSVAMKFESTKWLPKLNAPVFIETTEEISPNEEAVGHIPGTAYTVGIDIAEAVTHNTAIVGDFGTGKSFLAMELIERMIAAGIKIICLDLTNQYDEHLSDFFDPSFEARKMGELNAIDGRGMARQHGEEGGIKGAFKAEVVAQLREFLDPDCGRYLRVYNLTWFDIVRQVGEPYRGSAAIASLTPCEIAEIISESALEITQEMGMSDSARVCLVIEEAHLLVPDRNSVAEDQERETAAAGAFAISQGRKCGLGCLLVTQWTGNVTRTILKTVQYNLCNANFRRHRERFFVEPYRRRLRDLHVQHWGAASRGVRKVIDLQWPGIRSIERPQ